MSNELIGNLEKIKRVFEESEVSWMIFAGVASILYGSRRPLTDLDIILKREDFEIASSLLKIDPEIKEGTWGQTPRIALGDIEIVTDITFFVEKSKYEFKVDGEMISRRVYRNFKGLLVPVIPPEDNIVVKAILQRGASEGKHDLEDVMSILKNNKIDIEYLKRRIGICGARKRVNPVLMSFGMKF